VNDFALMYEERRHCARCKGLDYCKNNEKGYCLSVNEFDEFSIEECKYQRVERQKRNSLIKTLYLPDGILDAKLESFDTNSESRKKIFAHITEYGLKKNGESFDKGLLLYGSFSRGKTYALAVIANELSKRNVPSLLIYFPDLVLDLKGAIGTNRFEELINMLKDIEVLMLDDLGSENMTPWLRDEILGPIINYRMMAKKPIYFSSNLNPNDLKKHLAIDDSASSKLKADRILSRLTSLAEVLNMDDSTFYNR
ncbi:MAG: ATP-binding protein, partial [Anaeroplasma sp.]|uniref:DnaA ATPase domain-containing protein n=1 Tax=Anaeroplasma sp. TaxID=1872523 RepID=UPI002A9209F2